MIPSPSPARLPDVDGTAERMFILQLGAEHVQKALSIEGGGSALYWEPFLAVVVETAEGCVLFDTGMSRAASESADIARAYGADSAGALAGESRWHLGPPPQDPRGWSWVLPGDPLVTGLASIGLEPEDISTAVVSHLHVDHSGGIPTLTAAGVPVVIGQSELAFARSGQVGESEGFHPPDWTHPATTWRAVAGDTRIAPGVSVISTPGHTPGHLSLAVSLRRSGTWVFCADASDLGQNLLDGLPCGSCTPNSEDTRRLARVSAERLHGFSRAGARVVPGHDPIVAALVRHPDGGIL
ncbi:N-acyl homoserine lactonase family protein [Leifsonia sp. AG29]|uniref:N-acyl homoserine lactonase family protein n=1 Tax=Leifsonia sp. AG29 TaxID=2598860 RepID=UPI00131A8489|nr:N-acyl homoserine lactonase family protein [Leifsonia sp. AG29]